MMMNIKLQVAFLHVLGEVRDPERRLLLRVAALAFALAVRAALALASEGRRHVRRTRSIATLGSLHGLPQL